MNRKNTKRALCMSFVSLLLCCSMLVGSTFAWFTDTASTTVNSIQSGRLEVDLVGADGNSLEGKALNFKKAAGHESEAILWEPGCTYELEKVTIVNKGNLALKYKVVITGINGDDKLNEVIDWTISTGIEENETDGHLAAGESRDITISGHMQESAGNDYQGKTIDGIAITVYATQDTVEYDSTTNQYDADAKYEDELDDDGNSGGVVTVKNDEELTAAIEAKAGYTVESGDYSKTVVADAVKVTVNGGTFKNQVIAARNGGTVIINNAVAGSVESGGGPNIVANVTNGSTVIINGGSYLTNTVLHGDGTGTVKITGGSFDCGSLYIALYGKPVADLTITGGTFSAMMCMGQGMMGPNISDFVPDTHQIVNNADGSCTVVAK